MKGTTTITDSQAAMVVSTLITLYAASRTNSALDMFLLALAITACTFAMLAGALVVRVLLSARQCRLRDSLYSAIVGTGLGILIGGLYLMVT